MDISNHKIVVAMMFGLWMILLFPSLSLSQSGRTTLAQPSTGSSVPDASSLPTPPHLQLSNGSYLDIPNSDSLKLTVFTLSTWFNGNQTKSGNHFIISKGATGEGEGPGGNMNYGLYIDSENHIKGGFETAEGFGSQDYILTSQSNFTDNNWHHIVLTYNGSDLVMLVDGKLEAANKTGGALPDTASNDPLRIGAKSSDQNSGVFTGLADNIIVLNTPVALPLDFASVSQLPASSKIVDIESPQQIAGNASSTGMQSDNGTTSVVPGSPPFLLR